MTARRHLREFFWVLFLDRMRLILLPVGEVISRIRYDTSDEKLLKI